MPSSHEHDDEPVLIFMDGADTIQLEEGGKVYRPGDPMPKNMSHQQRVALQSSGVRFETRHREPVVTPEGTPAEMAAAEQLDPPAGGPAVVAAVEDKPKDEPAPRASRKGSD